METIYDKADLWTQWEIECLINVADTVGCLSRRKQKFLAITV